MKRKQAFTAVEILLTLSILGFMLLMIMLNTRKQTPDIDKARFKKAYLVTEQTVSNLINDQQLYPSLFMGFKYTDRAITEFGEVIGDVPENKFRDAFMFVLDPVRDELTCILADGSESNTCFMTDDGIVYGIPSTDFASLNNFDNQFKVDDVTIEKFVPIAVYTNWEKVEKSKEMQEQEAMYIGIQYDGNVRIFHPEVCDKYGTNKHKYCKAEEYIMSESIKKGGK